MQASEGVGQSEVYMLKDFTEMQWQLLRFMAPGTGWACDASVQSLVADIAIHIRIPTVLRAIAMLRIRDKGANVLLERLR
mmetsp:Transcript_91644/g.186529  ORF Transcript_91644/g.186529 Transcript_91644/m.186529 type:complete len:80 (+) Transcript_91644:1116-1355(+)